MTPSRGPRPATIRLSKALGISIGELNRLRQQVSCSLVNLGEFRLYWLPEKRRVVTRSVTVRRRFGVPEGAVLVGKFSPPITQAEVVRDLAELVATLPAPALVAPADPCELPEPRVHAKPEAPAKKPAAKKGRRPRPRTHSWNAYFRASKPAS
ncbi:MAG: hypothetical protein AB7P31_15165 [Steroidobacteraceae bacterium]